MHPDDRHKHQERLIFLTAFLLLISALLLLTFWTRGCSFDHRRETPVAVDDPSPSPDESPQPSPSPSALPSPTISPACLKTVFSDVSPILAKNCVGCHAAITTYATANTWSAEIARRIGLPTSNAQHMPQGASPQLSGEQISLLQKWVSDGSLNLCDTNSVAQKVLTEDYLASAMVADASALSEQDRPFTRYLLSAHAINAGLDKNAQGIWQAGMNKALNGLNGRLQDIFKAQAVDPAQSIWRIDTRSFDISQNNIKLIEKADVNINIIDNTTKGRTLQGLLQTRKPWFHADNFLDITYRNSDVYYRLVGIPGTLAELQAALGVNFERSIQAFDTNFLGSSTSPIAEQKNRLIVRVPQARSQDAYFWQTFDVNAIPNNVLVNGQLLNTKNLFQFPLLNGIGAKAVFTQDASEIIFTLPNGMQGYMLTDAQGNRLNFADPNVVIDTQTPLGNKTINNANSCVRCHNQGIIPMVDQVARSVAANAAQFTANDVALVARLYASAPANKARFVADNKTHAVALEKAGVSPVAPDPMSVMTDRFLDNYDINKAAALLFLSPDQFSAALNTSAIAKAQIGQLLTLGGTVTFAQFTEALPQLIKDARIFQDPLGN